MLVRQTTHGLFTKLRVTLITEINIRWKMYGISHKPVAYTGSESHLRVHLNTLVCMMCHSLASSAISHCTHDHYTAVKIQ